MRACRTSAADRLGVAARRLEFGIGVRVGLDDRADVRRQLRVLLLAAPSAAGGEVLQAADPAPALVEPLLDGLTPPAEASFGLAGVAAAQFGGDLGLERAALISGEPPGPGTDQGIEAFDGAFHEGSQPGPRDGDRLIESLASSGAA